MRDDLPIILFFVFMLVLFIGSGYMIQQDMIRQERSYNACISAGNQYISGDCVK